MARTFTYRGPFEVFSQEGGFEAPGTRRAEDGEDSEIVFFAQFVSASQRDDLITEILRDVVRDGRESIRIGDARTRVTITVEVDPLPPTIPGRSSTESRYVFSIRASTRRAVPAG